MSSVLVGIIGIALFIGIAISGAIFLGPKFDDAQLNSIASSTTTELSKIAAASSSYAFTTGTNRGLNAGDIGVLLSSGILKAAPVNIAGSGRNYQIVRYDAHAIATAPAQDFVPEYVFLSLGTDRDLCTVIERQAGGLAAGQEVSTTPQLIQNMSARKSGCFRGQHQTTDINSGDYIAYVKI